MIQQLLVGTINIIGSLGLFLFGMKILSDGMQKAGGEKFQQMLNFLTSNRVKGVFTGFIITSIIQSSSATTVILVGLVNAGLINLSKAISVIMGANIGTTMTAWFVTFLGFKFKIEYLIMPALAVSIPLIFSKFEQRRNYGEILAGFGILFLGLSMLKQAVPSEKEAGAFLEFITKYINQFGFFSIISFVLIGTIVTMIIQSSSAAMTITLTLLYKGLIDFPVAAALCLGENIGTTITAFLASLGMNVNAKRAARAHMLFNIFGVIWVLTLFYPFIKLVDLIIPGELNGSFNLTIHLSGFHSIFNISNTFILIWFVPQFAFIVEKLVPEKEDEITGRYKLNYISTKFLDFAESNIALARNEIGKLAIIVNDMLLNFLNALKENKSEIEKIEEHVKNQEEVVNIMYNEISKFLANCRREAITDKQSLEINSLLMVANEIRSISITTQILTQLIIKKYRKKMKFHKNAKDEIKNYTEEVLDFLKYTIDCINRFPEEPDMSLALKMETAINQKRNRLRKQARNKMEKGADVNAELIYLDIIKHLEHIGDFSLNIAHALNEIKKGDMK